MKTVLAFLTLLASPRVRASVEPEDASRLETGIDAYLKGRSWWGAELSAEQRARVAAAIRESFEKHPRKFSKEDVDTYLGEYCAPVIPGRADDVRENDEKFMVEVLKGAQNEASAFSSELDWYAKNGKDAERQLSTLIDCALAEFREKLGFLERNAGLQQCVAEYFSATYGERCRTIEEALKSWLTLRARRAIRLHRYRNLWKEEGTGDGTLSDEMNKLRATVRELARNSRDGLLAWQVGLAERLDGDEKTREQRVIASQVLAYYFSPIASKLDLLP